MDCSRCGGELETYSLGDEEAYVCGDCGFVDTPVEHEATHRPEPEPWETALRRFHEKYVEGDVAITGSGETAALVEIERDEPTEVPAGEDDADAEPSGETQAGADDDTDQAASEDTAESETDTADEAVEAGETDTVEDADGDDTPEVESEDSNAEPAEGDAPTDEQEKPA